MATDEQLTGASRVISIGDKDFDSFPLSDKDLTSLTLWIRYHINKEARLQAQFAESAAEAEEIKSDAFKRAAAAEWFTDTGINLLMREEKGLIETVLRMIKHSFKREWFEDKFGTGSKISEDQFANRRAVQDAFIQQNTLAAESESSSPKPESQKKVEDE